MWFDLMMVLVMVVTYGFDWGFVYAVRVLFGVVIMVGVVCVGLLVVVVFTVLVGGVEFGGFCVLLRCLVGDFAVDLFGGIVIVVGYF